MAGHGHANHFLQLIQSNSSPEWTPYWNAATGNFSVRNDVFVNQNGLQSGNLTIGFGDVPPAGEVYFGPEVGFGWFMGDFYQEPVLIIKSAWGGLSLATDLRPPSAGGIVGWQWTAMLNLIHTTLGNLVKFVPSYRKRDGYEIAGFVWFQGEADAYTPSRLLEYQSNLLHFIQDIRNHLATPDLPFIIGEMGGQGAYPDEMEVQMRQIEKDVAATAPNTLFAPTAFLVDYNITEVFDADYHYYGRADVFVRIGRAFARNLLVLLGDESAPTAAPSAPSHVPPATQPTLLPITNRPTSPLSLPPTSPPTLQPTVPPTNPPSLRPSTRPTTPPTNIPTLQPTARPSAQPTTMPPSLKPTSPPTNSPTLKPTTRPTTFPTYPPSMQPTALPTLPPTNPPSLRPTTLPTIPPTNPPSLQPTTRPTAPPTNPPTSLPTTRPTVPASAPPTNKPSVHPNYLLPTAQPSTLPIYQSITPPSTRPSTKPSRRPTKKPIRRPTRKPTGRPTSKPTSVTIVKARVRAFRKATPRPTLSQTAATTTPPSFPPTAIAVSASTSSDSPTALLIPLLESEATFAPTSQPSLV